MSVIFRNTKPLKEIYDNLLLQIKNSDTVEKIYIVTDTNGDISDLTLLFKKESNLGKWCFRDRNIGNTEPNMLDFDSSVFSISKSNGVHIPSIKDTLSFRDSRLPQALLDIAASDILSVTCHQEDFDAPIDLDADLAPQLESLRELLDLPDAARISLVPNLVPNV